jgi:hypothetical protein
VGDRHCGFCGAAMGLPVVSASALPAAAPAPDEKTVWVEAARARARQAAAKPAPPTKAHLSQADVDNLFG